MGAISASLVKTLRDETGLPMMECKSALTEADGDTERAKELLQKKYKGKMASRAANETAEGRVVLLISDDKKIGAIIELCCETAPVAKTDQFIALGDAIVRSVYDGNDSNPSSESVLASPSPTTAGRTIDDEKTEVFGLLRENIKLGNCRRITGEHLCGYVHHDRKSGVLIALDQAPTSPQVGVDLCHHVVFANPMAITADDIPADQIESVRKLAGEVALDEGKPAHIVEKIVAGKVQAFCAENALMEQEHVKVSKTKVGDVLKEAGVNSITDLCTLKLG